MESAIQTIVKVFLKSAKGKESLGQNQFQGLVKGQLSNILSDADSKEAVKNMGQGLDADHDGKVGFEEYLQLVGYLATSLSEQHNLTEKAASQAAQTSTSPDKEAEKPKEVKPGESLAAEVEAKPEANTEAKEEAVAEIKVKENEGESVEIKLEGETEPVATDEEMKETLKSAICHFPARTELHEFHPEITLVEEVVAAAEEKVEKIEEATSLEKKE